MNEYSRVPGEGIKKAHSASECFALDSDTTLPGPFPFPIPGFSLLTPQSVWVLPPGRPPVGMETGPYLVAPDPSVSAAGDLSLSNYDCWLLLPACT